MDMQPHPKTLTACYKQFTPKSIQSLCGMLDKENKYTLLHLMLTCLEPYILAWKRVSYGFVDDL